MIGKIVNLHRVNDETTDILLNKLYNDMIVPEWITRYPGGRCSAEFVYEGRRYRTSFTYGMINDQHIMWVFEDSLNKVEDPAGDRKIEMEL